MVAALFNAPSQRWNDLTAQRSNLSELELLCAILRGSHMSQDHRQPMATLPSDPANIKAAEYANDPTYHLEIA
jgi:nitrate/nitrite transport system substrate-binding protein